MEKGHARINATLDQFRELSSDALEAKLYAYMPEAVFRLFTFEEDDYKNGNMTIFCFNFIPTFFFVTCSANQDVETVLAEVAKLNPGLEWVEVEAEGELDEVNLRRTHALRITQVPAREGINEAGGKVHLTQLDIQAVHKTLRHPAFQMGAIGMFSNGNPLNPCFISPRGMVFIYGNDHFGVVHINERHGWFTDGSEWRIDESGRQFLDSPSKFERSSVPMADYTRIADEIYKPENKKMSKEEIFEKYSGAADYAGETGMIFHLIVYKGTKIVHSLFPQSKKLNRKKRNLLIYKKGNLKVEYKPFYDLVIAKVPYYNDELIIRYVIIIKLDNNTGCRQIWIETTNLKGNPLFCEKVQETFGNAVMGGERFFTGLEYADYRGIEKWIKDFDSFLEDKLNSMNNVVPNQEV
jgi:hypothetical protein